MNQSAKVSNPEDRYRQDIRDLLFNSLTTEQRGYLTGYVKITAIPGGNVPKVTVAITVEDKPTDTEQPK